MAQHAPGERSRTMGVRLCPIAVALAHNGCSLSRIAIPKFGATMKASSS
jgi:hypothetical protein